jgi:hypothetical protein
MQKFEAFCDNLGIEYGHAGEIAGRSIETGDKAD